MAVVSCPSPVAGPPTSSFFLLSHHFLSRISLSHRFAVSPHHAAAWRITYTTMGPILRIKLTQQRTSPTSHTLSSSSAPYNLPRNTMFAQQQQQQQDTHGAGGGAGLRRSSRRTGRMTSSGAAGMSFSFHHLHTGLCDVDVQKSLAAA